MLLFYSSSDGLGYKYRRLGERSWEGESGMSEMPEPWLRATHTGLHPVIAAVLYSFEQALEDISKHTEGLSAEQTWARPYGLTSVGFHIRHIAGSVDRLLTYTKGQLLDELQMRTLQQEVDPEGDPDSLLAELRVVLERAGEAVQGIAPSALPEARKVGRKGLPTTVAGLLVHIAEHTQRHVGQAVVTAKLARALATGKALV